MVLPLIAAGARAAASRGAKKGARTNARGVKNVVKHSKAANDNHPSSKPRLAVDNTKGVPTHETRDSKGTGTSDYRGIRPTDPKTTKKSPEVRKESKPGNVTRTLGNVRKIKKLSKKIGLDTSGKQKAAAVTAIAAAFPLVLFFYTIQLFGWLISMAGLIASIGTESLGVVGGIAKFLTFDPIILWYAGTFGFIVPVGVIQLFVLMAFFMGRKVSCYGSGSQLFLLALCFSGLIAPIINFLPWAGIWGLSVVFTTKKDPPA